MIASVRGEVSHVGLDNVVVEVGGVGVLVHVTPATAATLRTGSTAYRPEQPSPHALLRSGACGLLNPRRRQ